VLRRPTLLTAFAALLIAPLQAATPAAPKPSAATRPVSFNRDIRPIMSDTCFLCHGPDAKSRKAGMRLDIREEALKRTRNDVLPIVPGKPADSEIIKRIMDDSDPMPPEDVHKQLTRAQKETFRRWVAEGAVYEPHWAYAALAKPPVPTATNSKNPIDAFIRTTLAEKHLEPSPEAPKARLLRRLSLDLTGLPPTPEEVTAFLADKSPNAYEKQVDRLLASPHHGERMAVWWLDIARFADTVGFHGDQNQRIFPYRDYVINAFNTNKHFDQFTVEQLAGDLLPSPTPEQLVATGYNRLNMMTREGGAQAKEYLAKYGAERVRSVSAAWFGSTFGCAECHDHKFDPIKSADFYQLQAFFADMKQWGVYSDYTYTPNPDLAGYTNDHPFPPEIQVNSPYLAAKKNRLEAELKTYLADTRTRLLAGDATRDFEAWLKRSRDFLAAQPSGWVSPTVTAEIAGRSRAMAKGKGKGAEKAKEEAPPKVTDQGIVQLSNELKRGESLRLTAQPAPGSYAALRIDFVEPPPPEGKKSNAYNLVKLTAAVRDADGKDRKLDFAFADANAKEPYYLGGDETVGITSGWKVPRVANGSPFTGIWILKQPLTLAEGEKLVLTLTGEAVPPLHVSMSPLAAADALSAASDSTRQALRTMTDPKAAAKNDQLFESWLLSTGSDAESSAKYHQLAGKIRETHNGKAWSLITEPAPPITVRVLPRGNWLDETAPIALPATPSFLPGRKESTPDKRLTRLDLAQWIVSRDNPITARTVVNRLWAMYFGTGLSAKLDDLGSQGEAPSHPELLDWLASEFRDGGWDLRHIIRLIVSSGTYRQDSNLRPEAREIDPANRLLSAQNPRRLEAEFVRDNALFIAGGLNIRDIGGPSVKPYQPPGYYAALQFPDRDYEASKDDEQWRRGVYMHWQRTFLHPMLANFDAPSRDECTAQRTVSNTPQQALTLLNDPEFVEAARLFAARLTQEAGNDDARFRRAYLLALSREPKPAELKSLQGFLATQREYYRANAGDAEKLLSVGLSPKSKGDPAELAAWTTVARVILNSHEVITRY
jgi:hypothetical protein